MKSKRLLLTGVLLFLVVIVLVVAFISRVNAPTSTVIAADCLAAEVGEGCIRFPTVTGANLLGTEYTLPDDFAGVYNLVILPFDEEQQVNANSWLPLVQSLAEQYPDLRYYNIPSLKAVSAPIRTIITVGMSAVITDAYLREITIMLFLEDQPLFLDTLDIPDVQTIQVVLLDAAGQVVWRGSGLFDEAKGLELSQKLAEIS